MDIKLILVEPIKTENAYTQKILSANVVKEKFVVTVENRFIMPTNFFEKIVKVAHQDGIKFTFDTDCQVKGCNEISEWEQDITHQEQGKMKLHLCNKHMADFDADIGFEVEVKIK